MVRSLQISEFCKTGSGTTPLRGKAEYYQDGKYPWVKSGELRENIIYDTEEKVTELALDKTSLKLVPKGAILLAMYGATVGRSALLGIDATTNQAICHIIPDPKVANTNYLLRYLQYRVPTLIYQAQGGAQPNINQQIIKRQQIPLPPMEEQRRIAAILDKADELRCKRRRALARLDDLLQSVFLELFGDPLNPEQKENYVSLSSFAEIIMGQSPPGSSYNDRGEGVPLLNGPTEFGKRYPTEKQWTSEPKRFSEAGDILFCVRGATAGRLNFGDKKYCIGRGVAAIRPKPELKSSRNFLYIVLDRYYPYFQNKGVGSTFINISRSELSEVQVPNSSLEDILMFQSVYEQISQVKENFESQQEKLDRLFGSLQQRAFRGEL